LKDGAILLVFKSVVGEQQQEQQQQQRLKQLGLRVKQQMMRERMTVV
jgi:hypothetical protein